jgi:hypothetical protein
VKAAVLTAIFLHPAFSCKFLSATAALLALSQQLVEACDSIDLRADATEDGGSGSRSAADLVDADSCERVSAALDAAAVCLAILTAPGVSRALATEDAFALCVRFTVFHLKHNVLGGCVQGAGAAGRDRAADSMLAMEEAASADEGDDDEDGENEYSDDEDDKPKAKRANARKKRRSSSSSSRNQHHAGDERHARAFEARTLCVRNKTRTLFKRLQMAVRARLLHETAVHTLITMAFRYCRCCFAVSRKERWF